MLTGARNPQFLLRRKKVTVKTEENTQENTQQANQDASQVLTNAENNGSGAVESGKNQTVGAVETQTLDVAFDTGEMIHVQDKKIDMTTPHGEEIKIEAIETDHVSNQGSTQHIKQFNATITTPRGSIKHINEKLSKSHSSDGTVICANEIQTDHISRTGSELHTKEKKTRITSPRGSQKEIKDTHTDYISSDGSVTCVKDQEITLTSSSNKHSLASKRLSIEFFASPVEQYHVLDLLKIGKTYPIDGFTGSVPDLHARALVHRQHIGMWESTTAAPKWAHEFCSVKVVKENELGKHLLLTAKVNTNPNLTTTPYGVQGIYQVKVCLKKQGSGVVCTHIKGKAGVLSLPTGINAIATSVTNLCDLSTYGAGSKKEPLALPVQLKDLGGGNFALLIEVDANKLNLSGASSVMLSLLTKLSYVQPSKLEGCINLGAELIHQNISKSEKTNVSEIDLQATFYNSSQQKR